MADPHAGLPTELFHYTDVAGFEGIVRAGSFWLTHYAFLNDPTELHAGNEAFREHAADAAEKSDGELRSFLVRIATSDADWADVLSTHSEVYLASFTEASNSLYHWRGYGKGRNAVALGLDRSELELCARIGGAPAVTPPGEAAPTAPHVTAQLAECLYNHEDLAQAFRVGNEKPEWAAEVPDWRVARAWMNVLELRARFKLSVFEVEREWRLVFSNTDQGHGKTTPWFRTNGGGIVPTVTLPLYPFAKPVAPRLPLTSVQLGPECNDTVERGVKMCLAVNGYDPEIVRPATIALR